MILLYNLFIFLYQAGINFAAFFGNQKAKQWIDGRRNQEIKIREALQGNGNKRVWFHCASLGEFEQGRPLIEKLKSTDPEIFVVLTFFSPSGYEKRKDYNYADLVCYLPADTKRNAQRFIRLVAPTLAVFVKYEYWYHFFRQLKKNNVPVVLASAVFRPSQVFFKPYGFFFRRILADVDNFFVQDKESAELLKGIGLMKYSITGDTRFDRVSEAAGSPKKLEVIEKFKQGEKIIVGGSTWLQDEKIFLPVVSSLKEHKFKIIIAPHEVTEKRILDLKNFASTFFRPEEIARYSETGNVATARILIIDNIGLLLHVYSYCDIAWIGGGFGKGIHNVLEAAAFGLPVLFGPEYGKFREAKDLVSRKGAYEIKNEPEAVRIMSRLLNNPMFYKDTSRVCSEYVKSNTGATEKIYTKMREYLTR